MKKEVKKEEVKVEGVKVEGVKEEGVKEEQEAAETYDPQRSMPVPKISHDWYQTETQVMVVRWWLA